MLPRWSSLIGFVALAWAAVAPATALAIGPEGQLYSAAVAQRYGLTPMWATQVRLDRTRDRMTSITQHHGLLFVQTRRGTLQAIDAETGRTRWHTRVGERDYPSLAATSDGHHVAVVNGGHLYVLSMEDGAIESVADLKGAPAAPPAMGHGFAYVPLLDGMMMAYELGEYRVPEWRVSSAGRPDSTPLVTQSSVVWATRRGLVYGSRPRKLDVIFRFEANAPVVCTPAYKPPLIYVGSQDHYVYAMEESTGDEMWRFSTEAAVSKSPAVVDESLYVVTDKGGMYSLSADAGREQWWTPEATQFLAASPTRVYAADRFGRTLLIDAATGTQVAKLNTVSMALKVTNIETDRLYLANETGLLQCIRETALVDPVRRPPPLVFEAPTEEGADAAPSGEAGAPAAEGAAPAAEPSPAPAGDDDPFGEAGGDPFQ